MRCILRGGVSGGEGKGLWENSSSPSPRLSSPPSTSYTYAPVSLLILLALLTPTPPCGTIKFFDTAVELLNNQKQSLEGK
ncbi:hypothetical protein PGT21_026621 [Puccinia graminis f. sp. tritici]|uniref:Uncharacterized protein n=1 Tax=Puccinia graminis f. sp. tritici TaxID=56615 RepID=A0A5B0RWU3_PUCGR|nr:hypothetical protein PGT21_026621 [Puccinia graminis f. sp. tritici]KAA1128974.1 hypothetical protein PGTUg99_016677 [Puccinia graminis f. sp. tritici]